MACYSVLSDYMLSDTMQACYNMPSALHRANCGKACKEDIKLSCKPCNLFLPCLATYGKAYKGFLHYCMQSSVSGIAVFLLTFSLAHALCWSFCYGLFAVSIVFLLSFLLSFLLWSFCFLWFFCNVFLWSFYGLSAINYNSRKEVQKNENSQQLYS